jgi:hypothetical protein
VARSPVRKREEIATAAEIETVVERLASVLAAVA